MYSSIPLRELIAKRIAFHFEDGINSPERKELVDELFRRTRGARCHRVVCRLEANKICGLAFHSFHLRDGGGFQNVSQGQQRIIEAAAPPGLLLEFEIDRQLGFKHWTYRADCSGDAFHHRIVVQNFKLPHPPGRRFFTESFNHCIMIQTDKLPPLGRRRSIEPLEAASKKRKNVFSPQTLAQIAKWLAS